VAEKVYNVLKGCPIGEEVATEKKNLDPLAGRFVAFYV
jgi:hypothetical protein